MRNVWVVILITVVGYIVGFRVQTNFFSFLGGIFIVLFFAYAICWGFAIIGLTASNSESAQLAAFPIIFPFVFASSAFVPVTTMPGWLQAFAKNQPVSQVIDATRQLMLGTNTQADLWSVRNVYLALAWSVGFLVVLAPLAIRRYRRVS